MSKHRYDAMMVEEYIDKEGNGRSKWTKIGAAFANESGSVSIQLNALPINGKVVLQVPLTKEEREAKFGNRAGSGDRQPQARRGQSQPQQGGFGNYASRAPKPPPLPAQHPAERVPFDDDEPADDVKY